MEQQNFTLLFNHFQSINHQMKLTGSHIHNAEEGEYINKQHLIRQA